jgi:hypothetical protein
MDIFKRQKYGEREKRKRREERGKKKRKEIE